MCLLLLLDSTKPVFGQIRDELDLNQAFVGFLVQLDCVKSVFWPIYGELGPKSGLFVLVGAT